MRKLLMLLAVATLAGCGAPVEESAPGPSDPSEPRVADPGGPGAMEVTGYVTVVDEGATAINGTNESM